MCKGPLRLGVSTSVHNVNISSHIDASSVSDMYVSLALNFTYIHVWASLYYGTLLNLKYWLDPFTPESQLKNHQYHLDSSNIS